MIASGSAGTVGGVKNPATRHLLADHEFLPEVCPHLDQVTPMRRGVTSLSQARTV